MLTKSFSPELVSLVMKGSDFSSVFLARCYGDGGSDPSGVLDKVAVASIPESILTTGQEDRSSSSWEHDSIRHTQFIYTDYSFLYVFF